MIEVVVNDRLGKKARVKCRYIKLIIIISFCCFCSTDDTIGDLKKLIAAQLGIRPEKIVLKKWYNIYKDHITLADCIILSILIIKFSYCLFGLFVDEITDGMCLEIHFQ